MYLNEESENRKEWFALRVTYSRELKVKAWLDALRIESYVPMHFEERTYNGQSRKVWTPLIHNLLFIRLSAAELRTLKSATDLPIRYIMDRASGSPAVIPERQMHDFMAVVATCDRHVEIVPPESVDLSRGDRVRVTGGPFAGIEGRYIRHKGHSKVAVAIRDVATALTAYVPTRFIEKLDTDTPPNTKNLNSTDAKPSRPWSISTTSN